MPTGEDLSAYDGSADAYDAVRPGYPDAVFSTVESYADFEVTPRVLEVGSGTGQATRQMTRRGWQVHAIEPGERLAAVARARRELTGSTVQVARFEEAVIEHSSFDLVAAATSWHWLDPAVAYRTAHDALKPRGAIALFWNAHVPDTSHPAWAPIRSAYLDVVPELADLPPLTPDRRDYDPVAELRGSGCFTRVERQVFAFELVYSTEQFLTLIDTYASHAAIAPPRRARLHHRLRAAIEVDLGGVATKPYEAVLVLGQRKD